MSGLEILGTVSSILQVISFGFETIGLCKAIYDGNYDGDEAVEKNTKSMMLASIDIVNHLKTQEMRQEKVKDLAEVAISCNLAAKKLKDEMDRLRRKEAKKNIWKSTLVAFRSHWKKSAIDKLEKDFQSYQKTMESHILVKV